MNYVDEVTKLAVDQVTKLAVDCGAVISRTLSDGAQTRVEFSTETLDFYTAAIEKLTEEKVQAKCTTSEAVGYLKFTSNTDVVFTQNNETRLVLAGASPVITNYPDMPVYLAPPNYEALQAQNKQLVEYAGNLRETLVGVLFEISSGAKLIDPIDEINKALEIPLPAAMKGE